LHSTQVSAGSYTLHFSVEEQAASPTGPLLWSKAVAYVDAGDETAGLDPDTMRRLAVALTEGADLLTRIRLEMQQPGS
jgi:hypothetical protein